MKYPLTLFKCTGRPSKSSVAQLILHLIDVNDNAPYLVSESVFLCHPLQKDKSAKFEVADPDSVTQKLLYFLTDGGNDNWYISKIDGEYVCDELETIFS